MLSRPPPTPAPPRDGNDREALWRLFGAVDKDGSGQLTERELRGALVNGDYTGFDAHTVRMMIRCVALFYPSGLYHAQAMLFCLNIVALVMEKGD